MRKKSPVAEAAAGGMTAAVAQQDVEARAAVVAVVTFVAGVTAHPAAAVVVADTAAGSAGMIAAGSAVLMTGAANTGPTGNGRKCPKTFR